MQQLQSLVEFGLK